MRLFNAYVVWKKLEREIARAVLGKAALRRRSYGYGIEELPKKLPKIIWIYWDKPIETAPLFVKYAIGTWQSRNPGWDVKILSDDTAAALVDLPEARPDRTVQARSDVLRLELLQRYGGVWVDATCCCVKPLDHWLPPLMQSGFFAFTSSFPSVVVNSWFLAASQDNYLVEKWSRLARRYYDSRGRVWHYFWVMYLFDFIVLTDRKAAKTWGLTPRISAKAPSLLKRIISQPDFAIDLPDAVDEAGIPVHKISSSSNVLKDDNLSSALSSGGDIPLREIAARAAGKS